MLTEILNAIKTENDHHENGACYKWTVRATKNGYSIHVNYCDGVTFKIERRADDYIVIHDKDDFYHAFISYGESRYDDAKDFESAIILAAKLSVNAFYYYW